MPRAVWFDPRREVSIERFLRPSEPAFGELLKEVVSLRSSRGHPTIELIREDGSSMSIATDGARAFLVWTNSLGETSQSNGQDQPGAMFVYDYFGTWSEAPAHRLVALEDAVVSAESFLAGGIPDTQQVIFTPD